MQHFWIVAPKESGTRREDRRCGETTELLFYQRQGSPHLRRKIQTVITYAKLIQWVSDKQCTYMNRQTHNAMHCS